jgi:hypothetical protein
LPEVAMNPSPSEFNDRPAGETPHDEELLHRILAAVESDRRRGRLELALAIILSLATLASTWCGYQSSRWGGVQRARQAAADTAERKSAEDVIVGFQLRTMDGLQMLAYWDALRKKDTETMEALFSHIRPALQKAIEASLAAGVLHDPKVTGPLQRPEYVLEVEQEAKQLRVEAARLQDEAREAGQASGSYVSLTLLFASVLFFGGITGTFTSRHVRLGLGGIALLLFLVTFLMLIRLPLAAG